MTLETLRAAQKAGTFFEPRLIAHGSNFHIVIHSRADDRVVLRPMTDLGAAIRFLRGAGFGSVAVDISQWDVGMERIEAEFEKEKVRGPAR